MINIAHLTHAHRQAPWRIQRQWAGAFLLGALALAMVSALYLDVTSQAAIRGREIQLLQGEIADARYENANLQTKLAELSSASNMNARALALGYRPVEAGEIHYLITPGYVRPSAATLAASNPPASAPSVPPEYTESLLEWIAAYLQSPADGMAARFSQ